MMPTRRGGARRELMTVLLLLAAGCVRYQPRPLDPTLYPAVYRARRLDDARLRDWVARWGAPPAGHRWTPRQLGLAALALRADIRRGRAEWRAALAGETAAGVHPAPGVEGSLERAVSGSEGQSPWVVSLAALLTLELGGKRGARVQQARARTAIAESELRDLAWRAVRGAEAAALALHTAEAELADAQEEETRLAEVEQRERARLQEASLSSAELARTGTEVQAARTAVAAVAGGVLNARAALAGTLALPRRALDSLEVAVDSQSGCALIERLGPDSLVAWALTHRPEVGRALARYAAAEAEVRLAVARQYPDLDLGPGFIWDQGVHRWTVALALPSLLGIRQRAPIRAAEASRAAESAAVAEVQERIMGETEAAAAECQGAVLERAAADSQVAAAERAAALASAAYQRGESSGLEPALARLSAGRAERVRRAVARRLIAAGASLHGVLGQWSEVTSERWPDPRQDELPDQSASPP